MRERSCRRRWGRRERSGGACSGTPPVWVEQVQGTGPEEEEGQDGTGEQEESTELRAALAAECFGVVWRGDGHDGRLHQYR